MDGPTGNDNLAASPAKAIPTDPEKLRELVTKVSKAIEAALVVPARVAGQKEREELLRFYTGAQWESGEEEGEKNRKIVPSDPKPVLNKFYPLVTRRMVQLYHVPPPVLCRPKTYSNVTRLPKFAQVKADRLARERARLVKQTVPVPDPATGQPVVDPTTGLPVTVALDAAGQPVPPALTAEQVFIRYLVSLEAENAAVWENAVTSEELKTELLDAFFGYGFTLSDLDPETQRHRIRRVEPHAVVIDPVAGKKLNSARWVAVADILPWTSAKAMYDDEIVKRVGVNDPTGEISDKYLEKLRRQQVPSDSELVKTVEVWTVFSKNGLSLEETKPNYVRFQFVLKGMTPGFVGKVVDWGGVYDPGEFPLDMHKFLDRRATPWGISPFLPFLQSQITLNWGFWTILRAAVNNAWRYPVYNPAEIDSSNVAAMLAGDKDVALQVKKPMMSRVKEPITYLEVSDVPPAVLQLLNAFQAHWQSDVEGGDVPGLGGEGVQRSALGTQALQQARQEVLMPFIQPTDAFFRRVAEKGIRTARRWTKKPAVVEILGEQLAEGWIDDSDPETFTALLEGMRGGDDISVEVEETAVRRMQEQQRQQYLAAYVDQFRDAATQIALQTGEMTLLNDVLMKAGELMGQQPVQLKELPPPRMGSGAKGVPSPPKKTATGPMPGGMA